MFIKDYFGEEKVIRPAHTNHVFVLVSIDYGMTKSGIALSAHTDNPITRGFIYAFPQNMEYISKHYPELKLEDEVTFRRYAATYVDSDHFYDEGTQRFMYEDIYALNVDDIELIVVKETSQKEEPNV